MIWHFGKLLGSLHSVLKLQPARTQCLSCGNVGTAHKIPNHATTLLLKYNWKIQILKYKSNNSFIIILNYTEAGLLAQQF